MTQSDSDELENRARYNKLLEQLAVSRLSHAEAPHLHLWLSAQASEQRQQQLISTVIPDDTLAQQIKICAMLEKGASVIAAKFDFLNQFSDLDQALAEAFSSDRQHISPGNEDSSPAWSDFRERLARDGILLAKIARQAKEHLKRTHTKKGRPTKVWRNSRFSELFGRLSQLQSLTREECIHLATELWNIYFPKERINDSETADKIIRRELKRPKRRGQNAANFA